jgi:hypothetical protein
MHLIIFYFISIIFLRRSKAMYVIFFVNKFETWLIIKILECVIISKLCWPSDTKVALKPSQQDATRGAISSLQQVQILTPIQQVIRLNKNKSLTDPGSCLQTMLHKWYHLYYQKASISSFGNKSVNNRTYIGYFSCIWVGEQLIFVSRSRFILQQRQLLIFVSDKYHFLSIYINLEINWPV